MLIKVPFKGAFLISNFQPTASDSKLVNPPTDLFTRAGWNDFIKFFLLAGAVISPLFFK